MRNYKIIGAFIALSAILSGCAQTEFDAPKMEDQVKWTTTHTISQFIAEYASDKGDIFPVRPNSGTANLYSVDTISRAGSIVITGRVTSEDVAGNIYKNVTLQDTISGDAIKISVDAGSMSGIYPTGQLISIKCNGLAIGKYAELYQLGIVYYNNDTDSKKKGYEPGRIPYSFLTTIVQAYGMPEPNKLKVDTMTIAQITASPNSIHSRLVCIKNAYFTGNEKGAPLTSSAKIFAPTTNGVGYPQSRDITDGTGTVAIATSEYAKFAKQTLPTITNVGNITAIVGWYHDKSTYAGSWQLTIRSLDDLGKGFEAFHATIK